MDYGSMSPMTGQQGSWSHVMEKGGGKLSSTQTEH
jgi:hypothetical protein